MSGSFVLSEGDVLNILVGQAGIILVMQVVAAEVASSSLLPTHHLLSLVEVVVSTRVATRSVMEHIHQRT